MTGQRQREIEAALAADAEAEPLDNLPLPPGAKVGNGQRRLDDLARLFPHAAAVERWTREVLAQSLYQRGPDLCVDARLAVRLKDLDAALPDPPSMALRKLAQIAVDEPVPVRQPTVLAHALMRHGHFRDWLMGREEPRRKAKPADPDAAFRRLAQKLHPDKGGDPEAMAALNEIRESMRGT